MFAAAGATALAAGLLALDAPAPRAAATYSYQPPPAKAGDPLGGGTCAECHLGGLNSGDGSLSISAPSSYTAGQEYSITVTLEDPGQRRWGFELTALTSTFQMAGSLARADTLTRTQVYLGKTYISHTSNGINNFSGTAPLPDDGTFWQLADGPVSWTFHWTAPALDAGTVT
ncbi:MAG TPA: choice-of-anchor V domain-containing protein, partial [Candidatus Methylomirabilis sp.]|nr:choice-of-anchor V domain-containing protein [Candidatus Methylomirabilis sp.]